MSWSPRLKECKPKMLNRWTNSEWLSLKQRQAISHLAKGGIVWWKPGEGKTRIAIAWALKELKTNTTIVRIFCRAISIPDWYAEFAKLQIPYKKLPIVVHPHSEIRTTFIDKHDVIVVDELFLFKNPKALRTQQLRELTRRSKKCLGLSGNIVTAGDLTDIYGQLWALNLEQFLCRTISQFRSMYFTMFKIGKIPIYRPKFNAKKMILEKIASVVHVYFPKKEEKQTKDIFSLCSLTEEQSRLIKVAKELWVKDGGTKEIKTIMDLMIQIQKISNGWFCESNKIEKLKTLLEEILNVSDQVVVWTAFIQDVQRLAKIFANDFAILQLHSKVVFDRIAWEKSKVCIATVGSGASLNCFKDCEYAIYFSMNWKNLEYQQSRARTQRKDSKHGGCVYYHLHCDKPSLDSRVYQLALKSQNIEQEIIKIGEEICENSATTILDGHLE